MNAVGNHAPHGEVVLCGNADGLESGIVRYEPAAFVVVVAAELLDGELTVHGGDDDVAIVGFERLVDDNDVAAFRKLQELGVELEIRRVPDIAAEDVNKLFG